jgi:nicotinate-nucleotide--dimethylbenzimidazole phosphoribosyltransferase
MQDSYIDLHEAILKRRDTRHFTAEKVPEATLLKALEAAIQAPSVGLSQPWRFIDISSWDRQKLTDNFQEQRFRAEAQISDPNQLATHKQLKLSGIIEAPILLAVYCEYPEIETYTIGTIGNPRALEWSCACAIQNLWLSLTSEGFGAGWVSILDLAKLARQMAVSDRWEPLGIICIGRPATNYGGRPMLEVAQWRNAKKNIENFYWRHSTEQ